MNELFPAARCRGVLPPARHGETVFSAIAAHAAGFAESVKQRFAGHRLLPPLDFTISIGEFSLSGRLDNIRAERMVRCRCARLKAKDVVRTWIEHLVLNCLKESGYPRESVLIMEDGSRTFGCVAEPSELLSDILGLYWEGMSTPLRFFPESSLACAHKQEWNVERARKKWEKGFNGVPGEGDDPCFRLCFGEVDPFTEDFLRVSGILLTPLLRHLVED